MAKSQSELVKKSHGQVTFCERNKIKKGWYYIYEKTGI